MDNLTILKIGGSVITDKNANNALADEKNIQLIANEIAKALEISNFKLIIVHGAGSFGHPIAKKYQNSSKGIDLNGVAEIHNSVKNLNQLIINSLKSAGVQVLPIHPMSSIVADNLRIIDMQTESISCMLENGFVPVLHGDVVMDQTLGASIISGDQLIAYLGQKLKAGRIGLSSDVDGVLDDSGRVIKKITSFNFKNIEVHLKGSKNIDVTGGMREKVIEILNLSKLGFSAYIFNATVTNNISKFLSGKEVGTKISWNETLNN